MELFDNYKQSKAMKKAAIDAIDAEIVADEYDVLVTGEKGVERYETRKNNPAHIAELMDHRRKIKMRGIETGDIFKGLANVAIVLVMVGFEVSHILNQKGSRFVKIL